MSSIIGLSTLLSLVLILGGLASIVFPIAPSIPTIWLGIFIYAAAHGYQGISQDFVGLISIVAMATILLDYTLSRSGVKKLTVGPWAIIGAVVGGLVGSLIGPIYAFLVGPIVGALVTEMLRGHDRIYSYQTGNYTIVAFMGGTIIKLIASIIMIGLFILRLQGKL
ncbi:MAG: DUF456 domain-containing protein [Candidatus Kerfeldbacteria bacterium]|nr:DUF456 domain-containing protein [Candidatus Kerfeldbacteria bacterium]